MIADGLAHIWHQGICKHHYDVDRLVNQERPNIILRLYRRCNDDIDGNLYAGTSSIFYGDEHFYFHLSAVYNNDDTDDDLYAGKSVIFYGDERIYFYLSSIYSTKVY